jgi:hypothetical protein
MSSIKLLFLFFYSSSYKECNRWTTMHAGNGGAMQNAKAIGEGGNRQFSRQRCQEIHCLHLGEGIKTPLDDLVSRSLDKLPGDHVEKEYRIAGIDIGIGPIAKSDEADDLRVQACFLPYFTNNRGLNRFFSFDKPAWQGPMAAIWFLVPLDEEDCALTSHSGVHDDAPDPERIPPKIDKTTAASFRDARWACTPADDMYVQLSTALRTEDHCCHANSFF